MKKIKKLFALVIILIIPAVLAAQDKASATETVKFRTSIDCDNCVNTIMSKLPHEKGIKDVKCDLETKEVAVTYQKNKNNPAEIRKAIEKLGYTAKQVEPADEAKKPN